MSMYLSNADLSPVGAEIAEFIDDIPSRPEFHAGLPHTAPEGEDALEP